MTVEKLAELFEKHGEDEYGKFERVDTKFGTRKDLHAFILLAQLVDGDDDVVSAARHDEISLCFELHELAPHISEEKVIDLIRCGVRLDDGYLSMFV
jgi:hypothetical protein